MTSKRESNWNHKIKKNTPVHYIANYFNISIETATIIKMICIAESYNFIFLILNKNRGDYGSSHEAIANVQMDALDKMLQGFGVESIVVPGMWISNYWIDNCGLYVNQGDTYSKTIVFDTDNKEFICTSWGDFYETIESRLKIR